MNPSEPEVRVAFITAPDLETATRIARALVEERLVGLRQSGVGDPIDLPLGGDRSRRTRRCCWW